MHEASIVQALLDTVVSEAEKHGARSVSRVELSVGLLSGVDPNLLVSAFELMREGTVASSAELSIETPRITCRCRVCAGSYETERLVLLCPGCGSRDVEVVRGDELILNRLEMDVEEARHV